jgi:hypothetical protein
VSRDDAITAYDFVVSPVVALAGATLDWRNTHRPVQILKAGPRPLAEMLSAPDSYLVDLQPEELPCHNRLRSGLPNTMRIANAA